MSEIMTHEQEIVMLNETLQMCIIETAKAQSENQQLKAKLSKAVECIEFYGDGNSHYNSKYEWRNKHVPESGTETIPSGERARETIKELGEK